MGIGGLNVTGGPLNALAHGALNIAKTLDPRDWASKFGNARYENGDPLYPKASHRDQNSRIHQANKK